MYVYTFYIKCSVYNIYVYVYNWVVKRNYSLTSICRRRLCLLSHPGDLSAFILIKQVASRFVKGFLYMVFFLTKLFLEIMKFFLRNIILQNHPFQAFLVSCIHEEKLTFLSVKAYGGGGLRALSDMSAKKYFCCCMAPLTVSKTVLCSIT